MRIDFGASYKDVSRLLKVSSTSQPRETKAPFDKSLGALLHPASQVAGSTEKTLALSESRTHLPSEFEDIRAGLKSSLPELYMPEVKAQEPIINIPDAGMPAAPDVKTPALLEVKRIQIPADAPARQPRLIGRAEIESLLTQSSNKVGLNPALSMAVVKAESNFNPRAVSSDGHASKGLFQLLDSTGKDLLARGVASDRNYDPFDATMNVELGTSYLKYLHDIFAKRTTLPNDHTTVPAGDEHSLEKLAVAAFNAGEGRVASAQRRAERAGKDPATYDDVAPYLPRSTRDYVARVISDKSTL